MGAFLPVFLRLTRGANISKNCFAQFRAGDEIRTRDPNLGRVVLYQLSYSRVIYIRLKHFRGERRIRTSEGIRQQIYSLPQLATLVSPQSTNVIQFFKTEPMEGVEPTTC